MPDDVNNSQETLLSNSLEAYQKITIEEKLIIVSALDDLLIPPQEDKNLNIFAEGLTVKDQLRCKNLLLSAHNLKITDPGVFDVSGKDGESVKTTNMESKPGRVGGNGDPAGKIDLYLTRTEGQNPPFRFHAKGGDGGAGERGSDQFPGGNGGDGNNGGQVVLSIGLAALDWRHRIHQIRELKTLTARKEALRGLLTLLPPDVKQAELGQTLEQAQASANDEEQTALLGEAVATCYVLAHQYEDRLRPGVNAGEGAYGVHGEGKPNGVNGKAGCPGALSITSFGKPVELVNNEFPLSFFMHPSQCARMLERIHLKYWTLDSASRPEDAKRLMSMMLGLQERTRPFHDISSEGNIARFFKENEKSYGAINAVDSLFDIFMQVTQLAAQLRHGRSCFGYEADHVPLASFTYYENLLDKTLPNFKELEASYKDYFTALKENQASTSQIKAARSRYHETINTAGQQLKSLTAQSAATGRVISGYQVILPPLKKQLLEKIGKFEEAIRKYFEFDLFIMVDIVSSIASGSASEVDVLSELGDFLYDDTSGKIADDSGLEVDKKKLVKQVKAVQGNLESLKEGYQCLDNGTLQADDPGAGKLLAQADKLKECFSAFYEKFPHELDDLKKGFERYINKVVARNNQIITYNATVALMRKNRQKIVGARARIEKLNDQELENLKPNLPDMVSFMSALYYSARFQVMATLDLMGRAFRLWALSNKNPLTQAYEGKTPREISHTVLLAARNAVLSSARSAVENFGTNHSRFPVHADQQGIIHQLPKSQVDLFKETKQLMVHLPVATNTTGRDESEFSGMANVRVSKVRVWLDGVKTDNDELRLEITHTGEEHIADKMGEVFRFVHEPVKKMLSYTISSKVPNEEADFCVEQQTSFGDLALYAALSPFTTWHIEVKEHQNKNLDLSGVTDIQLEFHGTNYAFV